MNLELAPSPGGRTKLLMNKKSEPTVRFFIKEVSTKLDRNLSGLILFDHQNNLHPSHLHRQR